MNGTKYGVPSAQLNPATPYANYTTFNKQQTFIYDGVGNRQEFDDGADTYLYDRPAGGGAYSPSNVNEYYRIRKNGTDTSRTYDANGNLTNDGTFAYKYNYKNELIEVDPAGGGAAVQTQNFDCFGRRIYKQSSPPVYYYHDFSRLLETHDFNDVVLASFAFVGAGVLNFGGGGNGGGGGNAVVNANVGGSNYYPCQNALGSIALWTDASANNVEKDTYDVFGHPTTSAWLPIPGGGFGWTAVTDSKVAPFMFRGNEWDAASSTYSMGSRTYEPATTGRFDSRGTLSDALGNQYDYRANQPTRSTTTATRTAAGGRYVESCGGWQFQEGGSEGEGEGGEGGEGGAGTGTLPPNAPFEEEMLDLLGNNIGKMLARILRLFNAPKPFPGSDPGVTPFTAPPADTTPEPPPERRGTATSPDTTVKKNPCDVYPGILFPSCVDLRQMGYRYSTDAAAIDSLAREKGVNGGIDDPGVKHKRRDTDQCPMRAVGLPGVGFHYRVTYNRPVEGQGPQDPDRLQVLGYVRCCLCCDRDTAKVEQLCGKSTDLGGR